MHAIALVLLGAVVHHLYQEHRRRGIDSCRSCGQFEQIGKGIRYVPVSRAGMEVQEPYCRKCKPEIFPHG